MAKVDAMMMAAHQPSEVMVSAAMLDPSLANIDNAQVSLAGPDSIYISNILYAGVPYSALLKYGGGTSATVEAVYGPIGKLIPDSVGLSQTELAFVPPASLAVSNVEVGGVGYSGTLEYAGGNQLRVTGIRRVELPPTAAEAAQAAAAAAIAQAEADAAAAVSEALAAADAAMAEAEAAMADKAAAMADAEAAHGRCQRRRSGRRGGTGPGRRHDGGRLSAFRGDGLRGHARSKPGEHRQRSGLPGRSGLDLRLQHHVRRHALLGAAQIPRRHQSATVEAVYGPMGKLIPDSVGLSQTELAFVAPAALAVENVEVGGVGYSGTLEYAGGNQLQRDRYPPGRAAAHRGGDGPGGERTTEGDDRRTVRSDRRSPGGAGRRRGGNRCGHGRRRGGNRSGHGSADAAMADAEAAMAEASAAQAKVDAMMMAAYQPSEVMVSAAMLDPSLANIDNAQVSLAGPDSIYISNIMYAGAPYSALLKYSGGTSATVEAVYGPMGKLIPDSVGLSQVELDFVAPASLNVANVEVGGVGYSGTLEYAGGDQLRVTGIRRVTLPPTAEEAAAAAIAQAEADAAAAVSAAQAATDAAMADAEAANAAADAALAEADAAKADAEAARAEAAAAQAEAEAAQAKVDAMMMAAYQPSEVMVSAAMLDPSLANIDNAQVSLAGPDSIYISNIMYAGAPYSALLKYSGGTSATVEAVYGPMGKLIPDSVGLSQVELDFVAPASLNVSNVEVGGVGYSGTLEYAGGNQLRVTGIRRVPLPPTAAEAAQAAAAAAIAQAEAEAAAAVAQAEADAAAAVSRGTGCRRHGGQRGTGGC